MSYARTAMISVRTSPKLKVVLETIARREGVALSRWMERLALEEARRIYRLGGQDVPLPDETPHAA